MMVKMFVHQKKKKFHAGRRKISKAALCGSHFLDLYVHVFPYLHVIFLHSISLALQM